MSVAPRSALSIGPRTVSTVGTAGNLLGWLGRVVTADQRTGCQSVCSRNGGLSTLPPGLRGSGSDRTATYCGTLKSASRSLAKTTSSCGSSSCPGRGTTTAPTFSPIIESGTPTTATSPTAGCAASAFSTSTEYT